MTSIKQNEKTEEVKFTTWDCMNCKMNNKIKMPLLTEITDKKNFVDSRIRCSKCDTEHFVAVSTKEAVRCRI